VLNPVNQTRGFHRCPFCSDPTARAYMTAGEKYANVRVQRWDKPGMTETRMCGAYEKVTVIRRANAEEGKR
jgi:hypothetical protein